MKKDKLRRAIEKIALGYSVEEITEEYGMQDGEMKLLKRREVKKEIPPDLKAVQMLTVKEGTDYSALSDEELETEKKRLLAQLKEDNQ